MNFIRQYILNINCNVDIVCSFMSVAVYEDNPTGKRDYICLYIDIDVTNFIAIATRPDHVIFVPLGGVICLLTSDNNRVFQL